MQTYLKIYSICIYDEKMMGIKQNYIHGESFKRKYEFFLPSVAVLSADLDDENQPHMSLLSFHYFIVSFLK